MTIAAATRFWDRIAERYAADPIKDMAGYERTLERTAALLNPTDSVVEIGCGTGTTALRLAPSVSRIIASDVSPAMIAIARKKAEAQGCANVTFEARAAEEPGGPAGLHDAVLAFNVLHLVADRAAVLAEAHRLLKPGGLFISKTFCNLGPAAPLKYRLMKVVLSVMQLLGLAPFVQFLNEAELKQRIAAQGFEIVETRHFVTDVSVPFIVARKAA